MNQLLISFGVILLGIIIRKFVNSFVRSHGNKHEIKEKRIVYIQKLNSIILLLITIILLSIVWSVNFKAFLIFGSSFFALAGVALFASWSNLSNLTSSAVIFFSLPFKIGDPIKVLRWR